MPPEGNSHGMFTGASVSIQVSVMFRRLGYRRNYSVEVSSACAAKIRTLILIIIIAGVLSLSAVAALNSSLMSLVIVGR